MAGHLSIIDRGRDKQRAASSQRRGERRQEPLASDCCIDQTRNLAQVRGIRVSHRRHLQRTSCPFNLFEPPSIWKSYVVVA